MNLRAEDFLQCVQTRFGPPICLYPDAITSLIMVDAYLKLLIPNLIVVCPILMCPVLNISMVYPPLGVIVIITNRLETLMCPHHKLVGDK